MMNSIISLFLVIPFFTFTESKDQNHQQKVLQSIFEIEEFQKHLSYLPRFVGTNTRQEVLMLGFPELENPDIQLYVRNKSIRIISEKQLKELEHNFCIRIDEFDIKNSKANVLLSYQNARMYYEKKQKIMLDAQLEKTKNDEWKVKNYKLDEVNTSD